MIDSSMGDFKTQTKKKIEKIDLYFEDTIFNHKKFKCTFFPWVKLPEIKKELIKHRYNGKLTEKDLRLFCKNVELTQEKKGFFDYYKVDPESTIIIKNNANEQNIQNGLINPYKIFDKTPQDINNLLAHIQSGITNGRKPKLASEGTSGTYFLQNHNKKVVAVYKPFDQQPYAPNNPRNFVGELGTEGIRKGILSGQCATREVAAYLLDNKHFHNVPATVYVEFYHPSFSYKSVCENHPICSRQQNDLKTLRTKHGSLQQFIEYYDVVGNLGSHQFDIDEVQKIAILDLRILNCDRNEANILVVKKLAAEKGKTTKITNLVPIDHGLSFPDNFQIYDHQIVWMAYRQAEMPLTQRSLDFINEIDPIKDVQMLRQKLGFRQICLRNFRVAQIFLKKLAQAGFTLHQIGAFVYRNDDDSDQDSADQKPEDQSKSEKKERISDLEKIVKQAETIFFTVKENGIKSTVQFQIGLIKLRKIQQSLPELEEIKEIGSEETEKEIKIKMTKNSHKISLKETSIQKIKLEKAVSPTKTRNISLPNLKKKSSNMRERKIKLKKKSKIRTKTKNKNENWGEVFFHYFEDLVDRFICEKIKSRNKPQFVGRNRLLSDTIEL